MYQNTNIVIGADHSTDNVQHNITSQLVAALENTGIPFENAALDMGPFHRNTKVVYNLSSAAAQIYIRIPLSAEEETRLVAALEGIQGVASVYNRAQLDAMKEGCAWNQERCRTSSSCSDGFTIEYLYPAFG